MSAAKSTAIPIALAALIAVACAPPPPDPEEGKALLVRIRKIVVRDTADAEIDQLLATWDPAAVGTTSEELAKLRDAGRRARIQALLVDIQLAERDVSPGVDEVRALASRWSIDTATLVVRVDGKDGPATAAALDALRRKGFIGEARHWIAESQSAQSESDRVASLGMARQALADGGLTPAEAGVTDARLAELLSRPAR